MDNEKLTPRAPQFREEILNHKGLRPIPIVMSHGKTYDWNGLERNERQVMKKLLKKNNPKAWAKIERCKKIKIYCEPIAENVYFCDKCNKSHVAHELDVGASPLFIVCHNCEWPQAKSLGYDIPDSYKNSAPDIILRFSTEEEYESAPEELRKYLRDGALWMEKV